MVASDQTFPRSPTTQAAWIHQIHSAGGPDDSTTVFVGYLCCVLWFHNLSYVDKYQVYHKEG
jgi:hypothetical protein